MPDSHQNIKNPFSLENSELEEKMEAAVQDAMEEHTLPQMDGANPNEENNHSDGANPNEENNHSDGANPNEENNHSDDGYSWHDRVADLEKQVFALSNEIASLKENYRNGHFVIVAKRELEKFEENLAMYIYPRGRRFGNTEIFPRLMNWLNDQNGTPQGATANSRWLQVQRTVQWGLRHEDVLTRLRNYRPGDTTQKVETWNPLLLTQEDNTCIADLHHLTLRLTKWIEEEENQNEVI